MPYNYRNIKIVSHICCSHAGPFYCSNRPITTCLTTTSKKRRTSGSDNDDDSDDDSSSAEEVSFEEEPTQRARPMKGTPPTQRTTAWEMMARTPLTMATMETIGAMMTVMGATISL
jgi:hypothetical protein